MKTAIQFLLRMYKRFVSPLLPHACRFVPTCSEYAWEVVGSQGVFRGTLLAIARLGRCHPFARAGYDPPPRQGQRRPRIAGSGTPDPGLQRENHGPAVAMKLPR
jgi:uncharacterized protein